MIFCHTGCLSDKECGKEICSTDNDPTRQTNNCPHDKCCQPVVCKSSFPETSGGELLTFGQNGILVCDQGKVLNPWKHIDPESSQPLFEALLQCVKKHDANNSTSGEWEVRGTGLSADHIQCTEGRLASTLLYLHLQTRLLTHIYPAFCRPTHFHWKQCIFARWFARAKWPFKVSKSNQRYKIKSPSIGLKNPTRF